MKGCRAWNIDPSGKVRLSRKVLLKEGEGTSPRYPGAGEAHAASGGGDDRGGRGDRDRGPRCVSVERRARLITPLPLASDPANAPYPLAACMCAGSRRGM